jgi:hypothetical protein
MEPLKVAHESMVVLYEPETGGILHTHRVVTFEGGKHPTKESLEKEALEQLRLAQPKLTKQPAFLHSAANSMKAGALYKVDKQKKALVELSSPFEA